MYRILSWSLSESLYDFEAAYSYCGLTVPVLSYKTVNRIPFAKGMGSSSAAIVSGILAGLAMSGHNLQVRGQEELLQIATGVPRILGS